VSELVSDGVDCDGADVAFFDGKARGAACRKGTAGETDG